jgi:hemerythrin
MFRTYALVLSGVFVICVLILAFGGRMVYVNEAASRTMQIRASLDSDAAALGEALGDVHGSGTFLAGLPVFASAARDALKSPDWRKDAVAIVRAFLLNHGKFSKVFILDAGGSVVAAVAGNDSARAGHDGARVYLPRELMARALGAGSGRAVYFVLERGSDEGEGSAWLVASAFGQSAGILVFQVPFGALMSHLSPQAYLLNLHGTVLAGSGPGGQMFEHAPDAASAGFSTFKVSDTESVNFYRISPEGSPDLVLARHHTASYLKTSLIKLTVVSVVIIVLFYLSNLVVGFLSVRQFGRASATQRALIDSLAGLAERRDPITGSHLERTRNFSLLISRELRAHAGVGGVITERFLEDMHDAVPLHDIGKVAVPDSILLKPARLTPGEYDVMKTHVTVGNEILVAIMERYGTDDSFLMMARNLCTYHHEKYDGTGYPEGLRADAIPLEARIFAICDVYDALRAERPYKPGLTHERAVEIILEDRGRHFDPDVTDAFVACADQFYEIFDSYHLFDENYGRIMGMNMRDAERLSWTDDLAVGVERIDEQHREFIRRVNSLFAATLRGEGKREVIRELDFLMTYATHHFAEEEAAMRDGGYPEYGQHKAVHDGFIAQLAALREGVGHEDVSSALVVRVNAQVAEWIVQHILRVDRRIGEHLRSISANVRTA